MTPQDDLFDTPTCHRCNTSLMWRSTEAVPTKDGEQRMDVFECPCCHQLAAVPTVPKPKAA